MKTRITIRNVYTLILESNKILSKTTINSKQVIPHVNNLVAPGYLLSWKVPF